MFSRQPNLLRPRHRDIRAASDALEVVFQPICRLTNGEPIGYEALSRFPHGRPDEWFAAAHARGRGVDLEMLAVRRAIAERDHDWPYLAVNTSPMALVSPRFVDFLLGLPDRGRIVLELTEHTQVGDYDELCTAIATLRDVGFRIAVDDAGGGVSSFRHILLVAPEIIKLDRSLVADLDKDPRRQALAELLVQFASRTDAQLVAEGIERPEELLACVNLGITYGQGYLLGRPSRAVAHVR